MKHRKDILIIKRQADNRTNIRRVAFVATPFFFAVLFLSSTGCKTFCGTCNGDKTEPPTPQNNGVERGQDEEPIARPVDPQAFNDGSGNFLGGFLTASVATGPTTDRTQRIDNAAAVPTTNVTAPTTSEPTSAEVPTTNVSERSFDNSSDAADVPPSLPNPNAESDESSEPNNTIESVEQNDAMDSEEESQNADGTRSQPNKGLDYAETSNADFIQASDAEQTSKVSEETVETSEKTSESSENPENGETLDDESENSSDEGRFVRREETSSTENRAAFFQTTGFRKTVVETPRRAARPAAIESPTAARPSVQTRQTAKPRGTGRPIDASKPSPAAEPTRGVGANG